ncbi:hypothetical protein, partial [Phocaeicola massiliensis]|uniref:hypothetical protein n=1 Tax=Phocaeicola massiliensis TaxID=204516 RepID=UPI0032C0175F
KYQKNFAMNIGNFINEVFTFNNIFFIIIGILLLAFYLNTIGNALSDIEDQKKKNDPPKIRN